MDGRREGRLGSVCVVSRLRAGRAENRDSVSGGVPILLVTTVSRPLCGAHPSSCLMASGDLLSGGNMAWVETEHSPPSGVDDMNDWSYKSTFL
jgi:hypothetical protein